MCIKGDNRVELSVLFLDNIVSSLLWIVLFGHRTFAENAVQD